MGQDHTMCPGYECEVDAAEGLGGRRERPDQRSLVLRVKKGPTITCML